MKAEQKTIVKFKDANNVLYNVEIEITHRNGHPEFTMSGEGNGSMGQCDDSIKPKNSQQKRLLELWNKYHLNGMNKGTPKQTEMLKEMEKKTAYDYDKAKAYLNSFDREGKPITNFDLIKIEQERKDIQERIDEVKKEIKILEEKAEEYKGQGDCWIVVKDLNIKEFVNGFFGAKQFFKKQILIRNKKLEDLKELQIKAQEKTLLYDYGIDGKLYQYGATWHKVDLPENLWEEVEQLVKEIGEIEELSKAKGGSWEDITDYKKVALGKYLDLEPKEAEEDITTDDEEIYNYCGTDYYVLTEDEAQDKAEDYLGDELWQMAVESGNTELGKKEWVEYVISEDGYGTTLNSYDGTEYYDEDNKVYIMRC
ncbi:hypothetical protein JW865_04680 [Candidatus Bathyarchaeota archaeon]|nr:hypothetical protein [Candidatus Bathyarchaeota archaeon]